MAAGKKKGSGRRKSKLVSARFGKGKKGATLACKLRRNKKGVVTGASCKVPAKAKKKGKGGKSAAARRAAKIRREEAAAWKQHKGAAGLKRKRRR
jgi:hypothetical protein